LVLAPSARAQNAARATLKGLTHVAVLVESLGAEAQAGGLTREQLTTDVELRLRRSRIKVADLPSDNYLYVHVNAMKLSGGAGWTYAVHVGFNQHVTLDRNEASCVGETWNVSMIGVAPPSEFLSAVREAVGGQVDHFINDYLAVNQ
jgi:hypothetical protein